MIHTVMYQGWCTLLLLIGQCDLGLFFVAYRHRGRGLDESRATPRPQMYHHHDTPTRSKSIASLKHVHRTR